jgi:hypothetical protein
MNNKFNVNLDILLSKGLSFEGYFILWCLHTKDETLMLEYINKCRKIPTEIFNLLEVQQLITINKRQIQDNKITFNSLNITNLGKNLFTIQDFDRLFEELKQSYPSTVGNKLNKRRLHTDLKRCKALYKKIINDDLELHNNICKSAILYHQEKLKTNAEIYMQNLATWLHQENYNQYLEEAKLSNLREVVEESNITSI